MHYQEYHEQRKTRQKPNPCYSKFCPERRLRNKHVIASQSTLPALQKWRYQALPHQKYY